MRAFAHIHPRRVTSGLLACAALALGIATMPSGAATSSTVVSATVPSATTISTLGCLPGAAGVTELGTLLPGSTAVTSASCVVTFGSSNNTAALRMTQPDGRSVAMGRLPTGAFDTAGDGDAFSTDGIDPQSFGTTDEGRSVGQQRIGARAGKLVVGGYRGTPGVQDSFVARWTDAGVLDTGFGSSGVFGYSFHAATDQVRSMVVADDDSLFLVGMADAGGLIAKLTPDGVLDATYSAGDGTDGYRVVDVGPGLDELEDATLDIDGRLVVTGMVGGDALVARFLPDGRPDPSFGTGGVSTLNLGTGEDHPEALAIQPDGRIVVAGRRGTGAASDLFAMRFLTTGTPDPGFNGGAARIVDVTGAAREDSGFGVAVVPSGRIVVVGFGYDAIAQRVAVLALTAGGAVDTTWMAPTGYGLLTPGSGLSNARRVRAHADGSVVLAGQGQDATIDDDMLVMRLGPSGTPDSSFGTNGAQLLDLSGSTYAQDIALLSDGSYVVTGCGGGCDTTIARLESVEVPDFAGSWAAGSVFGTCLFSTGGGATASWPTTGACTTADATPWRAVPQQDGVAATVATSPSGTTTASANLRFGFKASTTQPSGRYEAQVRFDVVAPAA